MSLPCAEHNGTIWKKLKQPIGHRDAMKLGLLFVGKVQIGSPYLIGEPTSESNTRRSVGVYQSGILPTLTEIYIGLKILKRNKQITLSDKTRTGTDINFR